MEAKFWMGLALILTWESYAKVHAQMNTTTTPTAQNSTTQTIQAQMNTTTPPTAQNSTTQTTQAAATQPTTSAPAGGSAGWGGFSGSSCNMTHCPSCPTGYHSYQEMQLGCTYRCLCELNGPATQSSSRNLLMRVLGIIQNNAVALEKMAHGVSDEADLAQDIENLPHF